jgi:hypothetical protein
MGNFFNCCNENDKNDNEVIVITSNYHYLTRKKNLEFLMNELLNFPKKEEQIDLSECNTYERQEVQRKNQEIFFAIKERLGKYLNKDKNSMMKKAKFLKNIGLLVRFSHEIAIYIIEKLYKIFENKNHKKTRINFAKWIKVCFNEKFFEELTKKEEIFKDIKSQIEDNDEDNNKQFYLNIFPKLIKLYFYCYLADMKVDIKYANEGEEFDWDTMVDDLLTMHDEKKVLFTYLPGLYCNGQYFENSKIYVVTYTEYNPDKFEFKSPVFYNVEEKHIDYIINDKECLNEKNEETIPEKEKNFVFL